MSATIKTGTVVSFTYVIRDDSGEICEYRDLPVAYIHGRQSSLFPQIEHALEGRTVGHRAVVTLSAVEAFGEHDSSLTFIDVLDNVPEELCYVGAEFEAENEQGDRRQFRVTKIEDGRLTVDANHPLAGKGLTYEVTVVGIRNANDEELRTGQADPDLSAVQ